MDSYEKFAKSVWGTDRYGRIGRSQTLFDKVHKDDLDEIAVAMALLVTDLEYSDRYRVYPFHMSKEYWKYANAGCCGSANLTYRCKSGRVYLYGCNYGH